MTITIKYNCNIIVVGRFEFHGQKTAVRECFCFSKNSENILSIQRYLSVTVEMITNVFILEYF